MIILAFINVKVLNYVDNEDDQKTIDHNQGHGNVVNQGKWDLDDSLISRCEQGGTSSMGDKISLGEDMLRIDIIDQSSDLDGQVEKRFNDMVAIPVSTNLGKLCYLLGFEGFSCYFLTEVPLHGSGSITCQIICFQYLVDFIFIIIWMKSLCF